MTDWADLYRTHVDAISGLYDDLTDDQLALAVPATPSWTVKDVLAHLAGGAADAATGRMDDAPGPAWTARHVSERRELPVADLVAELHDHQEAIAESTVDSPRPAIVWNIVVHHADLYEALGRGRLAEDLWQPVLANAAVLKLGTTGVPEEVEDYEMFRALFSRRSRSQMQAWGLPLSPEQLDELCIFGPREDDQPMP